MEQRQEKQHNKPKKLHERTKQVLASAARSIKRVFAAKKLDRALWRAATTGDNKAIKRLLNAGASIAAKDRAGCTALHYAALNGRAETCALLIDKYTESGGKAKALIAAKSNNDGTALHFAAENGHTKICVLFVEKYAKAGGDLKELITIKNDEGRTAIDLSFNTQIPQFLGSIEKLSAAMGKEMFRPFIISFSDCIAA